MDYWQHLDLVEHRDLEGFLETLPDGARMRWFSTKSETSHWDVDYRDGDWLVFGSESRGLPDRLRLDHPEGWVRISMEGPFVRSLNLSSSVAVGVYEALRQVRQTPVGDVP